MTMVTTLDPHPVSEEISKAKLKARMLEIFRRLEREGGELIVTDNGRPALKIVPIRQKIPVEVVFAEQRRLIAEGKMKFPTRAQMLAPMDPEDYQINTDWDFPAPKKNRKPAKRLKKK